MMILTAKLSKKAIWGAIAAVSAVVILLVCLLSGGGSTPQPTEDDSRVTFLATFGYSVNAEPVQVQSVTVPLEDSEVFLKYNTLQQSQGYDLSAFRGQEVMRYVYEILDYDDTENVWYASVLVSGEEVIGGDVSTPGGAMHGFARP